MITVKPLILNSQLKWDGSHLGSYWKAITGKWTLDGIQYYRITLPAGWSEEYQSGIIYCLAIKAKDLFPCIVEEIKDIFGIPRCGIHRINIDYQEYFIYYVPISIDGNIIWETPLNRIDVKHPLRKNPEFRKNVQKIIMFSDILALGRTGEPAIKIRLGNNGVRLPISTNETNTTIVNQTDYDYSIMSKTLFLRWFGEETCMSNIVKEMVNYTEKVNNLAVLTAEIRSKVEEVIRRYDSNYIWYSNFILDRMSRYLLVL